MNTSSGASTPTTPQPQTIVLNAKQSAQLMEKLKAQQGGIRLITQTGNRQQLVAIPFSQPASGTSTVVSAAPNITLSPQKQTSLLPHHSQQARTIKIGSPRTAASSSTGGGGGGQFQAVKSQPAMSGLVLTPNKSVLASSSQASTP